jgi:hypothetical protein
MEILYFCYLQSGEFQNHPSLSCENWSLGAQGMDPQGIARSPTLSLIESMICSFHAVQFDLTLQEMPCLRCGKRLWWNKTLKEWITFLFPSWASAFFFIISFLSLLPRGMSFGPIHSEHAVNSKDSLLRWWRWIWMVDAGWCLVNAGEYYMTSPRKKSELSKLSHYGE